MSLAVQTYIEDFPDNAGEAASRFLADLTRRGEGDTAVQITINLMRAMEERKRALAAAFRSPQWHAPLLSGWKPEAALIAGQAGNRFYRKKMGTSQLIVLDRDLILALALFSYLVGFDGDDFVSQALAAFLLLWMIVPRDEQFPGLDRLCSASLARSGTLFHHVLAAVLDYVLFHEIGHSYIDQCGHDFLYVRFNSEGLNPEQLRRVKSVRFHPNGPLYNQVAVAGSANGWLLVSPLFQQWGVEMAADVFAGHAVLLANSAGRPTAEHLEHFTQSLALWQLTLFAVGRRQEYVRGLTGRPHGSHPVPHVRTDILVHHINHFAEIYAPDWSSTMVGLLRLQYDKVWEADLSRLVDDALDYVRYGFDAERDPRYPSDTFIRATTLISGDTDAGNRPVHFEERSSPIIPSALERLRQHFLDPFLERAEAVGWDEAVSEAGAEHRAFLSTYRLNGKPVILDLGHALHQIGLRLT